MCPLTSSFVSLSMNNSVSQLPVSPWLYTSEAPKHFKFFKEIFTFIRGNYSSMAFMPPRHSSIFFHIFLYLEELLLKCTHILFFMKYGIFFFTYPIL